MNRIYLPPSVRQRIALRRKHIYLIQRKQDFDVAGVWYFKSINESIGDMYPVIWTSLINHAHEFKSEEDVEEFRKDFLLDRSTEVIRLKGATK